LSVVEQTTPIDRASDPALGAVDLYMIRTRPYRLALFLPPESIEICVAGKRDRIRAVIRRLMLHRNGVVRWFGRVFRVAHRFYQRVEDKIDPHERMFKALNGPSSLRVFHAERQSPQDEFRDLLRGQIVKHTAWLVVDAVLTAVAAVFSPFLAWIPGPYVVLYYPALRLLSHYRAMTGARKALNESAVVFEERPELGRLEAILHTGIAPGDGCAEAGLRVTGLDTFLERMV
jgi:hypothetical protein